MVASAVFYRERNQICNDLDSHYSHCHSIRSNGRASRKYDINYNRFGKLQTASNLLYVDKNQNGFDNVVRDLGIALAPTYLGRQQLWVRWDSTLAVGSLSRTSTNRRSTGGMPCRTVWSPTTC